MYAENINYSRFVKEIVTEILFGIGIRFCWYFFSKQNYKSGSGSVKKSGFGSKTWFLFAFSSKFGPLQLFYITVDICETTGHIRMVREMDTRGPEPEPGLDASLDNYSWN